MEELQQTTLPPADIIKANILKGRKEVLDEIKEYITATEGGFSIPTFKLSGAIKTFYIEIEAAFSNDSSTNEKTKTKQEEVYKKIFNSDKMLDKINAFKILDSWLYEKGVLKFDTEQKKKVY